MSQMTQVTAILVTSHSLICVFVDGFLKGIPKSLLSSFYLPKNMKKLHCPQVGSHCSVEQMC